jgi:hypothetical protein
MIQKFLGAAAVVYAIVSNVYANADAANIGFTTIDPQWLVYGLPAVAGAVYPFLSNIGGAVKGIQFPSLDRRTDLEKQLDLLTAIGQQAQETNDSLNELFKTLDQIKPAKD